MIFKVPSNPNQLHESLIPAPMRRSVRVRPLKGGDVAVAVKEATAVPASQAFSCLLYFWGLFLGWSESAA